MTKYIFKTKFVKNAKEYLQASKKHYQVIQFPDEKRKSILAALKKHSNDSLEDLYEYYLILSNRKKSKYNKINKECFEVCQKLAENESVRGIAGLGYCYYVGCAVESDLRKALIYLRIAAQEGFAPAQFNLYHLLKQKGAYQDLEEANKWVRIAAEQEYAKAEFALGRDLYMNDNEESLKWFLKAYKQKWMDASYYIGDIYAMRGEDEKAIPYFKKAVSQGYDVYGELGVIYMKRKEEKTAISWFKRGADLGSHGCCVHLGKYYAPTNPKLARKYFNKALNMELDYTNDYEVFFKDSK